MDKADILCVGEQLLAFTDERLGEAPPELSWNDSLLQFWLPLDKWIKTFLIGGEFGISDPFGESRSPAAQCLDKTNWLSMRTHLRRLAIPDREEVITAGHFGRACPFEQATAPTPRFAGLIRRLRAAGVCVEIEDEKLLFCLAAPQGETINLCRPVPHPWLPERDLTQVGAFEDSPFLQPLVECNEKAGRLLNSNAPLGLKDRTLSELDERVREFLDDPVRGEDVRFSAGGRPWPNPYEASKSIGARKPNRVLFSGRTVIAPGAGLRYDQIGLPGDIAWELFAPLVIREGFAKEDVEKRSGAASDILDSVMARSWVILNRAPTVSVTHELAFHPVRTPGHVIRVHLMACLAMNADFDGDQAAVFLPITEAAQREAGERLSIAGHLGRSPDLLHLFAPTMAAMWGLACLSLTPEGMKTVTDLAGADVAAPDGFVTRPALVTAMQTVLDRDGVDRTLERLDRLFALGFEAAKKSGASISPFFGSKIERPPEPTSEDPDAWDAYAEDLANRIASLTDFDDDDIGPQLLSVKSGSRGNVGFLVNLIGSRGVVEDAARSPVIVRHGFSQGMEPLEAFACVAGARRALAEWAERFVNTTRSSLHGKGLAVSFGAPSSAPRGQTTGFGVLARAMRANHPGVIFAHAAATGETDPLTDIDSRLFVGLLPLEAPQDLSLETTDH